MMDSTKVALERLADAALELAMYASYAEIVGGIRHNRGHIREWCDKVFVLNHERQTALTEQGEAPQPIGSGELEWWNLHPIIMDDDTSHAEAHQWMGRASDEIASLKSSLRAVEAERDDAVRALDANWVTYQRVVAAEAREKQLRVALDIAVSRGCSHCAESIRTARALASKEGGNGPTAAAQGGEDV